MQRQGQAMLCPSLGNINHQSASTIRFVKLAIPFHCPLVLSDPANKMLSILRKAKLKDKELRILML